MNFFQNIDLDKVGRFLTRSFLVFIMITAFLLGCSTQSMVFLLLVSALGLLAGLVLISLSFKP